MNLFFCGDVLAWADGTIVNTNNLWVTIVDKEGRMHREDWTDRYQKIRKAIGAQVGPYVHSSYLSLHLNHFRHASSLSTRV